MEKFVDLVTILSPTLQALCGGLIAILGGFLVQYRSHKKERDQFKREIIEKCYSFILKIEDCDLDESLVHGRMVRDKSVTEKINFADQKGREADSYFDQLQTLINLYLPDLGDKFMEYFEARTAACEGIAHTKHNYINMTENDFLESVKKHRDLAFDKSLQLHRLLEEKVQKFI